MRVLLTLLKKEFTQIFRNRLMIPVIFVIPVVQMLVLVYAASLEMTNINMVVVDEDHSQASQRMISKFEGSPFFRMDAGTADWNRAEALLIRDRADVILRVGKNFEKDLYNRGGAEVQLVINAINATEAGLVSAYCSQIILDFNAGIRSEWFGMNQAGMTTALDIIPSYWYNPRLNYRIYIFPGILVILVTMIGLMLTAINLVREKEIGTSEQMNVTPVHKSQFLLAKLLPFWIIALFELSFGLVLGRLIFALPIVGNLAILFLFASVYLLVVMGLGLFFSTISNTQQQLMFMLFFVFVTFILMSGIFTPVESMPDWAQVVNRINPVAYFMRVIRMVLLKGSGFHDIIREFYSLSIYAVLILSLAVVNYRKTS